MNQVAQDLLPTICYWIDAKTCINWSLTNHYWYDKLSKEREIFKKWAAYYDRNVYFPELISELESFTDDYENNLNIIGAIDDLANVLKLTNDTSVYTIYTNLLSHYREFTNLHFPTDKDRGTSIIFQWNDFLIDIFDDGGCGMGYCWHIFELNIKKIEK